MAISEPSPEESVNTVTDSIFSRNLDYLEEKSDLGVDSSFLEVDHKQERLCCQACMLSSSSEDWSSSSNMQICTAPWNWNWKWSQLNELPQESTSRVEVDPDVDEDHCRYPHRKRHSRRSTFWGQRSVHIRPISLHLALALALITGVTCIIPYSVGLSVTNTSKNGGSERIVCIEGVSPPLPGSTFPRGDIFLKVGDTLEVVCKLDLSNPAAQGYNASDIDFKFSKAHIHQEDVDIKVVNESTAVVRVTHMNASSPLLQCVLKRQDASPIPVCQNQIEVGYPPLQVEEFRCLSRKWKSLECTWKLPHNPVPTKYTLSKVRAGKSREFTVECPNTTATLTSCTWDGRTEPHYRQNADPLVFRLNGTNSLMPSGNTWNYTFRLGSIVIPESPVLTVVKKTRENYMLNWTFLDFEFLPSGLEHELTIYDDEKNFTFKMDYNTTAGMAPYITQNVTLPAGFTNYTVSVRLRSPNANRTEEFWSDPEIKIVQTEARAPDFPPETDIGSFETIERRPGYRDVDIFWKSVPKRLRNGSKFQYHIIGFENKREFVTRETTDSYAKFSDLRNDKIYHFYITAENDAGKSDNASEITVPITGELPEQPKSVSKIDYTNGSFEISWRRPDRYHGILSYTIFRCGSKKPRPYICDGRLEWDRLEATKAETIHKFYESLPQHSDHIYQFAVSANTDKNASGMVWATCTLIHDKVPGKLKSVRYEDLSEDQIVIKWDLECSYRAGDIEGFKITYCQVDRYPAERCKDDESSVAVEGANMTTYRLMKLKPYSYYKIYVSILAPAGQSQRSDPIFPRTYEGAPSLASGKVVSLSNTSATLTIESPFEWNGILREYRIYYSSSWDNKEQEHRVPLELSNETTSFSTDVTLTNLTSNSNYTLFIVSCTSKCSGRSEPLHFVTEIGHTDLTFFPHISWHGGNMELEWERPTRLGGPIHYFQIMLKRNGKQITDASNYPTISYTESAKNFRAELSQACEPNANFTAQVRAVTKVGNGLSLYGSWSSPGNYSCGGSVSWIIWVILAFVMLMGASFAGYLFIRFYHYFKRMKEGLTIKLPPGLNSELNGFTHKPQPRGRGSDQSYGKDTYDYPLQNTSSQMDESKDFLSSSEHIPGEAEESLIEKPFCPSPTNPLLGGLEFSAMEDTSTLDDDVNDMNDIRLTEFSRIQEAPSSSPSYKKLGILGNGSVVSLEPVPGPSSRSTPSLKSEGDELSSTSANTISQISNHLINPPPLRVDSSLSNGINHNRPVPDVLNSSPSSPTSLNNASSPPTPVAAAPIQVPVQPHPPPPAPTSSYVKWTTLVPDMKTGDAGTALENANRQTTYCQVGILLDS